MRLIVDEVVASERRYRNETVGTIGGQGDKESRLGDTGNTAFELFADAAIQMVRDQPVDGVALCCHGAPLEGRDLRGDVVEHALFLRRQTAFTEPSDATRARCTIRSA